MVFILFVYGDIKEEKAMAFLSVFNKSANELKSVKCLVITAILVALACVLKMLTIQPLPTIKIGFSFLAIAAIGMLYGPSVAAIACGATDIIGFMVSSKGQAFSPLFTLVEIAGGVIYGIYLYGFNPVKADLSSVRSFFGSIRGNIPSFLRIVLAKLTVNIVCNVIMNTTFMVVMGYYAPETFALKIWERVIKNIAMLPVEIFMLTLILFPVKAVFTGFKIKKTP